MGKLLALLMAALSALPAQAADTVLRANDSEGVFTAKNLLKDSGGETTSSTGAPYWTASAGTLTRTSTTVAKGNYALSWDASAAAQTLTSSAVAIPDGMKGRNGVVSCVFKAASGTAAHTLTADDGTTALATAQTISSSTTTFQRTSVNFIFPTSGNVRLKITSSADEPVTYIDDCYMGLSEGFNTSQISQATFYGGMTQSGASNCAFSENTSTGENDYKALGTAGSCASAWTAEGNVTAPAATTYTPTINNMPPGDYWISLSAPFFSSLSQVCDFRIYDGSNSFAPMINNSSAGGVTSGNMSGRISYTTAATRTFSVIVADTGAGSCSISNDAVGRMIQWSFHRFPTTSEGSYRPDLTNWRVDASISGANVQLGTSAQTAYIGMEDAGLTLTNNTSTTGNVLTANIPCSSTNSPTGTTCAVGNESVGVSFDLPKAGDVRACAAFAHSMVTGASGVISTAFELVETASNSQTILQEGKDRSNSRLGTASLDTTVPHLVCGTFSFASAGTKTLRLMYEQAITATVVTNAVAADAASTVGQRDIHITVEPLVQSSPAWVGVGSVTSGSAGQERIERAKVVATSAGACSVVSQSGSWIASTTPTAAGDCTLNITAGMFSAEPTCTITPDGAGSTSSYTAHFYSMSTSALRFVTKVDTGTPALAAVQASIHCMGPR